MTQVKRKGARWLDIGSDRWSYYVGKKFVEIRDSNNKATLVPREQLDVILQQTCGISRRGHVVGCGSPDCNHVEAGWPITLPGAVAKYIQDNLMIAAKF